MRQEHTVVLEGEKKTEVPRGTQNMGGAEKAANRVAEPLGSKAIEGASFYLLH